MPRSTTLATLLMTATLGCSASAPDDPLVRDPDPIGKTCPALATSCPSGCAPAGAFPLDREKACLLPFQAWGCQPAGLIGPPAIGCSVAPDGAVWVAMAFHIHPQGRYCTAEEYRALASFSRCS